jgi:RND superfamily putative drug exporter
MFRRWGKFVYRHRRLVAGVALAAGMVSLLFAGRASSALSTGGWYAPGCESQQVAQRLASDFGDGRSSLIVLFQSPGRTDAASAGFQAAVEAAMTGLAGDSRVASVVGYAQTGNPMFISTAGDKTWVLVRLNISDDEATSAVDSFRSEISAPAGMSVQLTGAAALSAAMSAQSEKDLMRAETVSLPIALIILLLVFGTLVAAGLPLLVAAEAIPTTLAVVWLLAQQMTMSVFVSSVVTMLGLALAIDYSLFMVSRFREELARGRSVEEAVERTVATSGKAVAFSGSAVALGLSGLLFFRAPTISSMGIGGALTALISVAYALTLLPALLGMLGPRVERFRIRLPFRAASARPGGTAQVSASGWWQRIATAVMRHPVAVLIPVMLFLLALGIPFTGEKQGVPGASSVPTSAEARQAWDTIETEFPAGETSPIDLLITTSGDPLSVSNATAIAEYAARVRDLDGATRVDGPFSLTDAGGNPLPAPAIAALLAQPAAARPAALNELVAADVRGSTVHLQVVSPLAGTRSGQELVSAIRALDPGRGLSVQVGGSDASGLDFLSAQDQQLPVAVVFILVAMAVMLLLQFGSVVLPVKAVAMTLLSLTASFGALVWVFQDGNLSSWLNFASPGFTIAIVPILMFAVVFGLSMDYEVLLLSRIQESYQRTGDNAAAVGDGLAQTGRVITGAALIMVAVFAAFGLADTIVIKSLGVGMAIAVLLDATVIRALLVPATMRLLGRWNWWAPGPLGRLTARLGFDQMDDDPRISDGPRLSSGPSAQAPAPQGDQRRWRQPGQRGLRTALGSVGETDTPEPC